MEHRLSYRFLPIVLLVGLLPACFEIFPPEQLSKIQVGNVNLLYLLIVSGLVLPEALILGLISWQIKKRIGWLIFLLVPVQVIIIILFQQNSPDNWQKQIALYAYQGVMIFCWGLLVYRRQRAWPLLLFVLWPMASWWALLGSINFLTGTLPGVFLLDDDGLLKKLIYLPKYSFLYGLLYVLLLNYHNQTINGNQFRLRPNLVNLNLKSSIWSDVLMLIMLRCLILFQLIGMDTTLNYLSYFIKNGGTVSSPVLFSPAVLCTNSAFSLGLFVVTIYLYRNKLLTVVLQKGVKPGWNLLWCQMPLIGLFFFARLFFIKDKPGQNQKQRLVSVYQSQHLRLLFPYRIVLASAYAFFAILTLDALALDYLLLASTFAVWAMLTLTTLFFSRMIPVLLAGWVTIIIWTVADLFLMGSEADLAKPYSDIIFWGGITWCLAVVFSSVVHPNIFTIADHTEHTADESAQLDHFAPDIAL